MRFSKPSKSRSDDVTGDVTWLLILDTAHKTSGVDHSTPPHYWSPNELHQTLIQHRVGHLQEAADVGAVHQIARRAIQFGRLVAILVDGDHDLVQTIVHFFARPRKTHAVLRHFQSGRCHATSVGSL